MDAIAAALLHWYDVSARSLPWRAPPGTPPPDPYRVWLSEVMLQQTTVAAVIPYFEAFTRRWPTVTTLAQAEDAEVMAAWAGLGYYARARNLLACARAVAGAGGAFPETEAGLRALPGLGPYTAAAIAAIAFGERAVVVDANVERVTARLFAIATPLPAAKPAIRAAADAITPATRAGDFAQAMMDLGATICTAKSPRCLLCPLAGPCKARAANPESLPAKTPRPAKPTRHGRAYWIERRGREGPEVWLVTRPAGGMLGAMRALPDDGWSARADGHARPPIAGTGPGNWQTLGGVGHVFTHFALTLELALYSGEVPATLPSNGEWWPIARLAAAGLPTLFAKAASLRMSRERA